ncbi:MAG: hypothetical protein M3Y56_00205, partial [Armatimonadota bacterium]|nr:hypothetical protein [Armatimonadota bacterium]
AHAVEVFRVLDVPHVTVADSPRLHTIETASGPVQVLALPYRRASLLAEEAMQRGKSQLEVNEAVAAGYQQHLERMGPQLDPAIPTVLAGHLSVGGATTGSERSMLLSDEPVVPLSCLAPAHLPIDYVALGHMHRYQNLNRNSYPAVIYSGSLERVDFGEEKDEKGFVLVQLSRGGTTFEFHPVDARRFVTVECDLTSDNPAEDLERAIARCNVEDAVVRLRYTIPEDKKMLLASTDIHRLLGRSYCVGRVEREVTRPGIRQRDPHLTEGLDTFGALRRFLEVKPPKVDVEEMLEYGQRLIQEGEVQENAL